MLQAMLRKNWFVLGVSLLLAIASFNLYRQREGFRKWAQGFLRNDVIVDAVAWQRWGDANRNFFGPLSEGQCIALARGLNDYHATTLTKTAKGVRASRTRFRQLDSCLVSFVMSDATAQAVLALSIEQGDVFWNAWKQQVRSEAVQIYTVGSRTELESSGVVSFLRSIDSVAGSQ